MGGGVGIGGAGYLAGEREHIGVFNRGFGVVLGPERARPERRGDCVLKAGTRMGGGPRVHFLIARFADQRDEVGGDSCLDAGDAVGIESERYPERQRRVHERMDGMGAGVGLERAVELRPPAAEMRRDTPEVEAVIGAAQKRSIDTEPAFEDP